MWVTRPPCKKVKTLFHARGLHPLSYVRRGRRAPFSFRLPARRLVGGEAHRQVCAHHQHSRWKLLSARFEKYAAVHVGRAARPGPVPRSTPHQSQSALSRSTTFLIASRFAISPRRDDLPSARLQFEHLRNRLPSALLFIVRHCRSILLHSIPPWLVLYVWGESLQLCNFIPSRPRPSVPVLRCLSSCESNPAEASPVSS